MKIIKSADIQEFLNANSIFFELKGDLERVYKVASLFEPIKNGFYFFNGTDLPKPICDSLVLVNNVPENFTGNSNCLIIIKEDVQLIYYRLLSEFFSKKSNGFIEKSAIIHPNAKIGKNVQINHFCIIGDCFIGDNVNVGSFSKIHDNCVIGKNTIIEDNADIGTRGLAWIWDVNEGKKIVQPQLGGVTIGENCIFASNTIIVRGSLNEHTKVGKNAMFAPGCRIGHGTNIGNNVHFANNVITGGNTKIGANCFVGSSAVFRPKVIIDSHTVVGVGAVVVKNTSNVGLTLMGNPAKEYPTKEKPSGMPKPL